MLYVVTFASFSAENPKRYDQLLITLSTLEDETDQGTPKHCWHLKYVLSCYNKMIGNVAMLVGDNCKTKKAISVSISVLFVIILSQRYNLLMQCHLKDSKIVPDKVHVSMQKLQRDVMQRSWSSWPLSAQSRLARQSNVQLLRWSHGIIGWWKILTRWKSLTSIDLFCIYRRIAASTIWLRLLRSFWSLHKFFKMKTQIFLSPTISRIKTIEDYLGHGLKFKLSRNACIVHNSTF